MSTVVALACCLALSGPVAAQESGCTGRVQVADATDPAVSLLRLAYVAGAAGFDDADLRRNSDQPLRSTCDFGAMDGHRAPDSAWLAGAAAPARLHSAFTTGFPEHRRDGRLRPARGATSLLQVGAVLRAGPLTIGLHPEAVYQQNASFRTLPAVHADRSAEAYPLRSGIDWPQRFGATGFEADLGQSYVRLDGFGLKAGWSRELLVYGPARHSPLLLSGTSPGFPHWFVGTSGEVSTFIGGLDVETFWGRVRESDRFDEDPDNDERLLAGLYAAWRVPGLDGLRLGGARLFMADVPDELSFLDELKEPWIGFTPNDPKTAVENQILSAFFRWSPRRAGLEVYGEWAREDFWDGRGDLLREIDHSQAYTVGAVWVEPPRRDRPSRWAGAFEHTHLVMGESFQSGRPSVTFYTHTDVIQGLTHDGQLLGAPVGPGALASTVEAWHLRDRSVSSLEIRRVLYDVDAALQADELMDASERDTEWSFGLRHEARLRGLEVGGGVRYTHRPNRLYMESLTGRSPEPSSWTLTLDVIWRGDAGWSFRPRNGQ